MSNTSLLDKLRGIVAAEPELVADTTAVIQRHPEIVLVDEFAHSNPRGEVHEKRWEDIEQILFAPYLRNAFLFLLCLSIAGAAISVLVNLRRMEFTVEALPRCPEKPSARGLPP